MSGERRGRLETWLSRWSAGVRARRRLILASTPIIAGAAAVYAVGALGVDTSTAGLVADELPFRRAALAYDAAFPGHADRLIVVIEAAAPARADRAADLLADRLRADTVRFQAAIRAGGGPFLDIYGPWFLEADTLASLVDRLESHAPLLRAIANDPTLRGLATALPAAHEAGVDVTPLLGLSARSVAALLDGTFAPVPWDAVFAGRAPPPGPTRRLLVVEPRLSFENTVPGRAAVEAVHRAARDLGLDPRNGVDVRVTGIVAIQAEELGDALSATRRAAGLALISVAIILFMALRSFRLIAGGLVTLLAGLSVTSAFAAAAIGHLNLISVAFTILYVGLGIDYAIHLSLRYRALVAGGLEADEAIDASVASVGPSLAVSALTTAACFYAFIPTDFTGVSELGLIGGTGMLVSFLATITILPAWFAAWPVRVPPARVGHGLPALERFIRRARWPILTAAALGTAVAVVSVPRARFDHDPMNLRDPSAESMAAFRTLHADTVAPPLTASILVPDRAAAEAVRRQVEALPEVRATRTLWDFVPDDQAAKRAILGRLETVLPARAPVGGGASPADGEASPADGVSALRRAVAGLRWELGPDGRGAARGLYVLLGRWERLRAGWPPDGAGALTARLEEALVGGLPDRLRRLRASAAAPVVTPGELPAALRRDWIGRGGEVRVEVFPAEPLTSPDRVERFADAVRRVVPEATGHSITNVETARVAVGAFRSALVWAAIATTALLLVVFRSVWATSLVVLPLLMAAAWTGAATVLIGLPFNFANVIALPVLLGVGVDNGIHMVHQARVAGEAHPLDASTGRAVLFSTMTTIASFGNLALASHRGMASMGTLLTVGMIFVLTATLVVVPALIALRRPA